MCIKFVLKEGLNDFCWIHTIHHVVSEIMRPSGILSSMSNLYAWMLLLKSCLFCFSDHKIKKNRLFSSTSVEHLLCVKHWATFWGYVVHCSLPLRKTNRKPHQLIKQEGRWAEPQIHRDFLEARHSFMSKYSNHLRELTMQEKILNKSNHLSVW